MKHRYTGLAILVFGALLAACQPEPEPTAGTPVAAASSSAGARASSHVDSPKPEFPKLVVDTFDGGKFDLGAQRGRWVVVNFWATWCNPCLKEIPDLDALDRAREDVVVVGLAYEEIEKADMQAFLKDHPISYPIAVLDVYSPPEDFETPAGLPMTYLISPEGKVIGKHLGPVTSRQLQAEISAAGGAEPPA